MMIFSILRSGFLLLWSISLIVTVIFLFSIYLTQTVTFYLYDNGDLRNEATTKLHHFFGQSLSFSGYVLYQCMSGGISWGEVSDALMEIHWANSLLICFYIFFTVFAVLNIITGIFVDTALNLAMAEREEMIQEAIYDENSAFAQMQKFFLQTDRDKSGTISFSELEVQLHDQRVRAQLRSLGVEAR